MGGDGTVAGSARPELVTFVPPSRPALCSTAHTVQWSLHPSTGWIANNIQQYRLSPAASRAGVSLQCQPVSASVSGQNDPKTCKLAGWHQSRPGPGNCRLIVSTNWTLPAVQLVGDDGLQQGEVKVFKWSDRPILRISCFSLEHLYRCCQCVDVDQC